MKKAKQTTKQTKSSSEFTPEYITWLEQTEIRRKKDGEDLKDILSQYEANPKMVYMYGFNTLAENITKELHGYVNRQNDPKLAGLHDTFWYSTDSFRKIKEKYLTDCPVLPDLPTLTGNNYYAGLIHLKDYCAEAAKKVIQPTADNTCNHSLDFRSVRWFGTDYSFTPNQAAAVKILWEAWENKTPDVGADTLANEIESDSKRARDIFKGHLAFGSMICSGKTKGTLRLVEPDK